MKSKTLWLFIISALVLLGAFLFSIFKTTHGDDANFITGVIVAISLGIGIAGLIIGFVEIRNVRNTKNWIGLIGNLMVVGLFILITVLAFRLKKNAHRNVYNKLPGAVYGKVLSSSRSSVSAPGRCVKTTAQPTPTLTHLPLLVSI